jgi:PAS domain S-box-containing protein
MNTTLSECPLLPAVPADGAVFQALPMGVVRVRGRVFASVNARFCEMVGYAPEELVGRSTAMMFASDEDFQRMGENVYADLKNHGAASCQTKMRCKDGSVIEVTSTSIHSSPAGFEVTFVIMDVTKSRRAEQELFWQNRELTAFHRISEVMLSGQSTQSIFDTIARETSGMTDFPMVAIELCDFERAVMVYRGAHGIPLHEMPSPFEVPMDVSLSGQVAHSGEPLVEHNISDRGEYAAPILRMLGVQTFVCVPIKSDGLVVGTLSLSHRERIPVEPRVVKAASSLANYLATLFDRLQAREAVSRSEAELSTVYDRVPNVLCLFDEQLQIVRANLAATEFAGRIGTGTDSGLQIIREMFQCQPVEKNANGCGQHGVCQDCDLPRVLLETLTTGRNVRQVKITKTIARNGQPEAVVLLVSTERIQIGGIVRMLVCLEDITKNVRADEQIRSQAALLDITGDAIFVRDFSDRIIYWNEGAHRLYGWTPAEAVGRITTELMPSNNPFDSNRALHTVQHHDEWAGEMKQKSRAGRELTIQSRWTLVREPDGKPKAILVVNSDITEKKQLESQLLRGQRLESIGTLASGLAHDLNNVLAPIMMAVQFIKDNTEDDGMKACFQTLETCSRRGADIIRQVLMFARGVEGERILLNPKHLIQEMQRIANETFPRAIEINTRISKQPCVLLGDATQIQQVIMNLCVNARDAMPRGGVLTIGLDKKELDAVGAAIHPKAKPGSYVVISVSDTGTGIPPDLLDKIFDPFFTTKPIGQGTGLGLPTMLGIAENHGGFIHLESKLGAGATFHVYVPAAPGEAAGENRHGPAEPVKGNGELILIVDDEPSVRKLAGAILMRSGYRTVTAAEGREGIKIFEEQRREIKLVVSDLMMPQLDGPGMLRELRRIEPAVKCIIITGLGEENRITEAKSAGADLLLNKPFSADQLLANVQQLLARPDDAPVSRLTDHVI